MASSNGILQPNFNTFLKLHEQQLNSCRIPEHLWKKLHEKLWKETYDANEHVMLNKVVYEKDDSREEVVEDENEVDTGEFEWQVTVTCDKLLKSDPSNIFLIDHAWTFQPGSVRESLENVPALKERMISLMDLEVEPSTEANDVIFNSVWKFCRYYKLSQSSHAQVVRYNPELQHLRWYVLDELGSRIGHSDEPTARIVPFFYIPRGICYSVFWPIQDLHQGDSITVDYVEHVKDPVLRPYFLLPWQPGDYSDEPVAHTYTLTDEFFASHRVQETLPDASRIPDELSTNAPIPVYTDLALVRSYLTDPRFTLVDQADDARILWLYDHFKDYAKLSKTGPSQYVNQFPGEQLLTVKDLLSALASIQVSSTHLSTIEQSTTNLHRHLTTDWYPVTFNLVYELPQFVAYFQRKQKEINGEAENGKGVDSIATTTTAEECSEHCPRSAFLHEYGLAAQTAFKSPEAYNIWILKPWNAGRGLGITVTDNLNQIIRLCDTNPLIASCYVTDPVLFYRDDLKTSVKFDVRYVVLLQSVHPLKLFVYNIFWLRFANRPFGLNDFENYGKHFTVMNYCEAENLKQVHCDEFIHLFEKQYPQVTWSNVQNDIFSVLVDLFTAACKHPKGIIASAQSRAIYAVDLMLEWRTTRDKKNVNPCGHHIAPVVCEVNYSPDCTRACQYHPQFFNHMFGCLFLHDTPETSNVTQLV